MPGRHSAEAQMKEALSHLRDKGTIPCRRFKDARKRFILAFKPLDSANKDIAKATKRYQEAAGKSASYFVAFILCVSPRQARYPQAVAKIDREILLHSITLSDETRALCQRWAVEDSYCEAVLFTHLLALPQRPQMLRFSGARASDICEMVDYTLAASRSSIPEEKEPTLEKRVLEIVCQGILSSNIWKTEREDQQLGTSCITSALKVGRFDGIVNLIMNYESIVDLNNLLNLQIYSLD